jgi:hypothetical protein
MFSISFELIVVLALLSSLAALVVTFAQIARLKAKLLRSEQSISALREDISALCSGAIGLGDHLAKLEHRAVQLAQRQEKIEMLGPTEQSYRHARKLVGKGADLDEVIADCGLARGEAELVALAHKIKKAS